jgi:hypothetical protein
MASIQTTGNTHTHNGQLGHDSYSGASRSSSPADDATSTASNQGGDLTTADKLKALKTPLDSFLPAREQSASDSEQTNQSRDETYGGSLASGAAGGRSGLQVAPEAIVRKAAHDFFQEVAPIADEKEIAKEHLDKAVSDRNTEVSDLKKALKAHLETKPGEQDFKARNDKARAWVEQRKQLQEQLNSVTNKHKVIIAERQQRFDRADAKVDALLGRYGATKIGPVVGATVDNLTLKPYTALNTEKAPIKAETHRALGKRIENAVESPQHFSESGAHVEVNSANRALQARDQDLPSANRVSQFAAEVEKAFHGEEGALKSLTAHQLWIDGKASKGHSPADPAARCGNCSSITDGVNNLAGNARPESPKASVDGEAVKPQGDQEAIKSEGSNTEGKNGTRKPSKPDFSGRNAEVMKTGAKTGAAAGFLTGVIDSYNKGELDAKDVAIQTAIGSGTGALGGMVEETAARKLAGNSSSAARVFGSRVGGASVAGGLINAGFSAYDQIQAVENGEVTKSQAIGTVVGETAVGVGAGAAGAAVGAAVGSVIPVAGTIVGGAIGFCVGALAGWGGDTVARSLGADKAVAHGVTSLIDWATGG